MCSLNILLRMKINPFELERYFFRNRVFGEVFAFELRLRWTGSNLKFSRGPIPKLKVVGKFKTWLYRVARVLPELRKEIWPYTKIIHLKKFSHGPGEGGSSQWIQFWIKVIMFICIFQLPISLTKLPNRLDVPLINGNLMKKMAGKFDIDSLEAKINPIQNDYLQFSTQSNWLSSLQGRFIKILEIGEKHGLCFSDEMYPIFRTHPNDRLPSAASLW